MHLLCLSFLLELDLPIFARPFFWSFFLRLQPLCLMEAMEVVDEYGALRQLLHKRCPGSTFCESDIRSLWDAGFESEADLKPADRECLTSILPTRQGKVAILLRTFAQSEATTGTFGLIVLSALSALSAGCRVLFLCCIRNLILGFVHFLMLC